MAGLSKPYFNDFFLLKKKTKQKTSGFLMYAILFGLKKMLNLVTVVLDTCRY